MRASLPSRRAGRIGGVGHVENFLLVRTSDRTVSDYIKRMVANASAGDGRPVLEIARELQKLGRQRRKLAVRAAQDRLIKSIVRRDANRN